MSPYFAALANSLSSPIFFVDGKQRLLWANNSAAEGFKLEIASLTGSDLADALMEGALSAEEVGELLVCLEEARPSTLPLTSADWEKMESIAVESGQPSRGAIVCIHPRQNTGFATRDSGSHPSKSEGKSYGEWSVLVVDDSRISREIARKLLGKLGCGKITCVGSGAEALDICKVERFDIAFVDLQMPNMSGIELSEALRELPETVSLPLVALTGEESPEEKDRCIEAGMNDFILKPATMAKLASAMDASKQVEESHPDIVHEPPAIPLTSNLEDLPVLDGSDWEHDPELHARMSRMMVQDAPASLEHIAQAMEKGDLEECERHVHSFKGSSDVVRAERLTMACRLALRNLRANDEEGARPYVERLPALFSELKAELIRCELIEG